MKKLMSVAVVAFLVAGAAAFACDTCGCAAKKADAKKAACSACPTNKVSACTTNKAACAKKADVKKCAADCAKACCKKADA